MAGNHFLFCSLSKSQVIKERRSTCVHENHCKRLYGRYFYQKKCPQTYGIRQKRIQREKTVCRWN